MKVLLALSAFTAASGDVAFRWPDSSATTLATLLFGPLVFGIVWLTVRGSAASERKAADVARDRQPSAYDSEEALDFDEVFGTR
ncbi:MAG TPA: hypothetical protein VH331_18420 [Allosphingosinicella sp.]|jgi:hypothetical protein|nr:hypothetical protein [Allosphingosinicella sp.]